METVAIVVQEKYFKRGNEILKMPKQNEEEGIKTMEYCFFNSRTK
jgi:hypothetical protein